VKIVFAIFSAFEFVENAVREWTETLGTPVGNRKWKTFIFIKSEIIELEWVSGGGQEPPPLRLAKNSMF
jgi:hypothetical protein